MADDTSVATFFDGGRKKIDASNTDETNIKLN
jgi:hypothetical protein